MDWKVGDLALCIDDSMCMCHKCGGSVITGLRAGNVYRVLDFCTTAGGVFGLRIDRPPSTHPVHRGSIGCAAFRFRKIRPDEREACEPEFVTLLKRAKRPVSA
jgi:hypothetical protein